jgi:membrane protein DedA with SNARE-associated domain
MLQHLLDSATSRPAEAALLFLLALVREDLAVVAGGLLVVEHDLPPAVAVASLTLGILAGDFALFGLGRLARRSARVRNFVFGGGRERLGALLLQHALPAMLVSRIVPGLIVPIYVGCGLVGVGFAKFAMTTVATAVVYVGVLLWVVTAFGENVLTHLGWWAWAVFVLLLLAGVASVRSPPWGFLVRLGGGRLFARRGARRVAAGPSHHGMPSIRAVRGRVAAAERVPQKLFYAPLAAQWLWLSLRHGSLSLPTLANPLIEVGGLWGESKRAYLDAVAPEERRFLARYVALTRRAGEAAADARRALSLVTDAALGFPLVAKPDIGWQGYGVRLAKTAEALSAYVEAFPEGETLLLQEFVPWDGEAGVFYVRMPGAATGAVVGLTFRYFPHVVGDGEHAVRDLVLSDDRAGWKAGLHLGLEAAHAGLPPETLDRVPAPGEVVRLAFIGSARVGGLYRDAHEHITPALSARFDAISRTIPEFHYGRYDIRFASVERLREAEDFRIIEVNGAGAEAISVWDPDLALGEVYRRLFAQQRLLFEIGARNRARGFRPSGPAAVVRAIVRQNRLVGRYPPSS